MNRKAQIKIVTLIILYWVSFLQLYSCKEETLQKPVQIAHYAMEMIKEDNMEKIKEYASEEGKECINFFIELKNEIPKEEGLAYPGKNIHKIIHANLVQLGDTLITHSHATIIYKYKYHIKDTWFSIRFHFIKENDQWKIDSIK